MGDSIKFTIGGQLGASFRGALSDAMVEARAANMKMQAEMSAIVGRVRTGVPVQSIETFARDSTVLNKQALKTSEEDYIEFWAAQKLMEENAAKDAAKLATQKSLYNAIALGKIEKQEAEALAAQKLIDVERAASFKLAQDKMIAAVAAGGGATANQSGGGHGGGGIGGIIRESLVIVRELSMGRGMGRIGGSITLLAQYLGVLKLAVKSTATEALLASEAASKLSLRTAQLARAAKGTSGEAYFAAQAIRTEAEAAKAATAANEALATATVSLRWAFFGWVAVVVLAAAALYYLIEGYKAAKNSIKDFNDHLQKSNDAFADGVEALEAHHKAMLDDAKAAAELVAWQEKLAKAVDTTTDTMNKQLDHMKDEFEFKKKLAEQNGATPKQIAAMEQAERKAELKVEQDALAKTKKQADDARTAGLSATKAADEHRHLIDENKGKKDFDKTIEAVEYFNSRIPDTVKAKIKSNQALIDAQKARDDNGEQSTGGQVEQADLAKEHNAKLKSTEYGKQSLLGIGDGKAIVSPDEVDAIYQQALSARALFLKHQEDLQKDQDLLDKAKTNTQGTAVQRAEEVKRLQDKVDKDKSLVDLHDKYDPLMRNSAKGNFGATDWEKSGGSFGGHGISMLDIGKQQLKVQHQIERNTKAAAKSSHQSGSTDFGDGAGKT